MSHEQHSCFYCEHGELHPSEYDHLNVPLRTAMIALAVFAVGAVILVLGGEL